MSKKVFNLKHVCAQEADEVRELLHDHGIQFYETVENVWRTSTPAIWLRDAADYARARELIDHYQLQREQVAREQRAAQGDNGGFGAFWLALRTDFKRQPVKFGALILAIVVVILLSVRPFFLLD